MTKQQEQFVAVVWQHYKDHGRHDLLWRKKTHLKPYTILVSELMLQQTQVSRVLPKYRAFMAQWPTVRQLATASLGDVLRAWQGLGYNRRAKFLLQTAQQVMNEYHGRFPRTYQDLQRLPGVGSYTAAAVMNFAYNIPTPMIETNIRTVFIDYFFRTETDISDTDIVRYIELLLDREQPREWFWALMDYGVYLKQTQGSINARSKHYAKQSKFVGSDRQVRGALLRACSDSPRTIEQLKTYSELISFEPTRISTQLTALVREGLLDQHKGMYALPSIYKS